jgi:hypothetical protein
LKKIIAILALIGILFQTFSQVLIVAEYYANKDYIAKNLCENRDKPKMHVALKRNLQKKEKNKHQHPGTRKVKKL